MIKLQKYTPRVYTQQSRDFQFIGRLYDIVLNYVKTHADTIYSVPNCTGIGPRFTDLLALTLGFTSKHNYSVNQLVAICSIFPTILRNKGNIQAINLVGKTLLNSEGITDEFTCDMDGTVLRMYVPQGLTDINLLRDLMVYILPAGITLEISRTTRTSLDGSLTTLGASDKVKVIQADGKKLSTVAAGKNGVTGNISLAIPLEDEESATANTTVIKFDKTEN